MSFSASKMISIDLENVGEINFADDELFDDEQGVDEVITVGADDSLDDDEEELCTPPDVIEEAEAASLGLLPDESRERYERALNNFSGWKDSRGAKSFSERTLQAYFKYLFSEKKYKPSTMWSVYSMLNLTIRVHYDVDISKYAKLIGWLKRKASGYKPVQAKMFTEAQIEKFLKEAPDHSFLAIKVVLVFGTAEAMRSAEFPKVVLADLEEMNDEKLFVTVPKTKAKKRRSFIIAGGMYDIVKRYQRLRPQGMSSDPKKDRFFLTYRNGACKKSPIGINSFRQMGKEIARYLQLANPERYTSHTFRRSGTNTLANTGKADNFRVRAYGKWAAINTADIYIEETDKFKDDTSNIILDALHLSSTTNALSSGRNLPSTSSTSSVIIPAPVPSALNSVSIPAPASSALNRVIIPATVPSTSAMEEELFTQEVINDFENDIIAKPSVEGELFTQEVINEFSNDIITNSSSSHLENIMKQFTLNNCSNITFNFR